MDSKKIASVLVVSSECSPFAKTGGLGDIVRTVAAALSRRGLQVRVLLPGYASVLPYFEPELDLRATAHALGHEVRLLARVVEGVEVICARCDELYDRAGGPYLDETRALWGDNAVRFGVLCRVAAMIADGETRISAPDVLTLFDWHAALTPAYMRRKSRIPTLLVVQNFMFQGRFAISDIRDLELDGCEDVLASAALFDGFSFLQAGLRSVDEIVTASPGYVRDIALKTRHSWYYLGDRDRSRLRSITNWSEDEVWRPENNPSLTMPFSMANMAARAANRLHLQKMLGWKASDEAIICTVSRITNAKGFRFLLRRIDALMRRKCRIVVLGDGERRLINGLRQAAGAHQGRLALLTPYVERIAHQVLAGSDMLLMPSLTEPCGLSQQHAQSYGCVPIVSAVGGLADTVKDGETGFLFQPSSPETMMSAIDRALSIFRTSDWPDLQRRCMKFQAGFDNGDQYASLVRELAESGLRDRE